MSAHGNRTHRTGVRNCNPAQILTDQDQAERSPTHFGGPQLPADTSYIHNEGDKDLEASLYRRLRWDAATSDVHTCNLEGEAHAESFP
jgi:hypothetical protein